MGGSGGGNSCSDPPVANAVTFPCTSACYKVLLDQLGTTIVAESSSDDDLCEDGTTPSSHPSAGMNLYVWVGDPANNNAISLDSLGVFPSACKVKCSSAPNPGPAPDHTQMNAELFSAGYATVACGAGPTISLSQSCPNGPTGASYILQF
ncbi:MAG: hypothetical protein U0519_04640 [Candidatus Gracilibacteria bacterium]